MKAHGLNTYSPNYCQITEKSHFLSVFPLPLICWHVWVPFAVPHIGHDLESTRSNEQIAVS